MATRIICLAFLLLAVFHMGRTAVHPLDDPQTLEEYRRAVEDFQAKAELVMREMDTVRDGYFAALDAKINSRLTDRLVRSRRETTSDSDDTMAKLNRAFAAFKETVQTAASDISQTDLFKETQSKLKEFGATLSETGKKIGAKMQETMKDIS